MNPSDLATGLHVGAAVIVVLVLLVMVLMGLRWFFLPLPPDNYQSPSIRDNVRRVK